MSCELTEEQKLLLRQFRTNVEDILNPSHNDSYLMQWLKARKFNLQKAEKMLREHFKFRKKIGLDTILKDFELPEIVQKYIPYSTVGFDKKGNILLVLLSGIYDMKGFTSSLTLYEHIKVVVYVMEEALLKMKMENERTGKNGQRIYMIIDCAEMKLRQLMDKSVARRNLDLLLMFQANYPEILKYAFVLNVPRFFYLWFNIASTFLNAEILKKVKLYDTDAWKDELLEEIDSDNLPAFLGGTLTDPDGNPNCNTMFVKNGDIPLHYYVCNRETKLLKDPAVKRIVIKERTYYNYRVDVNKTNHVIQWTFCTIDHDIRFGVYYVPDGVKPMPEVSLTRLSKSFRHRVRRSSRADHELLVPLERLESHLLPEEGEVVCEKTGTYLLHFDNSYSWITPKELFYKVDVLPFSKSHLKLSMQETDVSNMY